MEEGPFPPLQTAPRGGREERNEMRGEEMPLLKPRLALAFPPPPPTDAAHARDPLKVETANRENEPGRKGNELFFGLFSFPPSCRNKGGERRQKKTRTFFLLLQSLLALLCVISRKRRLGG